MYNVKTVKFVVRCKMNNFRDETIFVDYVKNDGEWIPIPPNICDNGCNSQACNQCVDEVLKQAFNNVPPFLK